MFFLLSPKLSIDSLALVVLLGLEALSPLPLLPTYDEALPTFSHLLGKECEARRDFKFLSSFMGFIITMGDSKDFAILSCEISHCCNNE